jgi:hypothetical protein
VVVAVETDPLARTVPPTVISIVPVAPLVSIDACMTRTMDGSCL